MSTTTNGGAMDLIVDDSVPDDAVTAALNSAHTVRETMGIRADDNSSDEENFGLVLPRAPSDELIQMLLSVIGGSGSPRGEFVFCGQKSRYHDQIRLARTMDDYVQRNRAQIEQCSQYEVMLNNGLLLCTDVLHSRQQHNFLVFDNDDNSAAAAAADERTIVREPDARRPRRQRRGTVFRPSHFSAEGVQSPANYRDVIRALRTIAADNDSTEAPSNSVAESSRKRTRDDDDDDDDDASSPKHSRTAAASSPPAETRKFDQLLDKIRTNIAAQRVSDEEVSVTVDALESYCAALRNRNAQHSRVFAEYRRELQQRLRDAQRLRDTFTEMAKYSYCRILETQIRASKNCVVATSNAEGRTCSICCDDKPDCALSVDQCSCGPIGHINCILQMCWDRRMDAKPIQCPLCRSTFTEQHIRKSFYDNAPEPSTAVAADSH